MMAAALVLLVRVNLVGALVIAVILAVRAPVRRLFGVHLAYGLWIAVPLAMAGAVMPMDYADGPTGAVEAAASSAHAWLSAGGRDVRLMALWLTVALAALALATIQQMRFLAAEKLGRVGPAVVGFVTPRLVSPADFADRFTPHDWRLIRAHERAHIDRLDGRSLTLAVLAQCVCWFNPFAHMAVRAFRLDQELACDATVMERLPAQRRRYAEVLLYSEIGHIHPLFGSTWRGRECLETRIATLLDRPPTLRRFELGLDLLALFLISTFFAGWASQPPPRTPAGTVEAVGGLHIARGDLPRAPQVGVLK